jgi:hypothetical protein
VTASEESASTMADVDLLALDFDGVLCDGMAEYFETSRRTYAQAWPGEPVPRDAALPAFRRLRPVIKTGWEMPLLLRAIVAGQPEAAIEKDWAAVRDELIASSSPAGDALVIRTAGSRSCSAWSPSRAALCSSRRRRASSRS